MLTMIVTYPGEINGNMRLRIKERLLKFHRLSLSRADVQVRCQCSSIEGLSLVQKLGCKSFYKSVDPFDWEQPSWRT